MIDRTRLTNSLKKLEEGLRQSGKDETADFFGRTIVSINHESNTRALRKLLKQLCSSGAISQYADFSFSEDQLFDACYEEAKKILAVI